MKVSKVRGFVALALAVGVPVAGLATQSGFGSLSVVGLGSIAASCPVGALESLIGTGAPQLQGTICLFVAVAVIVVVGKAFCSWACPVPWLQKFFKRGPKEADASKSGRGRGAERVKGTESADSAEGVASADDGLLNDGRLERGLESPTAGLGPVGGERDGLNIDSRHAVLGATLLSAALFGFPVFCLICPVGLSFATLAAVWHLLQFNETTWGLVAFPLVLVLEVVFLRKWCFKFCPISALVSLVSRFNYTLKPKVDKAICLRSKGIDCRTCVDNCPECVDPHKSIIPECSKCHICSEKCPAKAIKFLVR